MDAEVLIARYGLEPHPEGGRYREIYRLPDGAGGRGALSTIYYLLKRGEVSAWHRIDAVEIWQFHAGDPLRLDISTDGVDVVSTRLGVSPGTEPQVLVPEGAWQSAVPEGAWTLVGCTVVPAFEFDGFEMAPPEWQPGK